MIIRNHIYAYSKKLEIVKIEFCPSYPDVRTPRKENP